MTRAHEYFSGNRSSHILVQIQQGMIAPESRNRYELQEGPLQLELEDQQ